MVAALPLPAEQATGVRRQATEDGLPPAPCTLQKPPDQQAREDPGDPGDYLSLWYAPLRQRGVSALRLASYDVHICARPDERKLHPAQSPRLYWRYPIWEEDGLPLTWRLAAVDGEHPRSAWDGTEHPELIYEPLGIIAGRPLVLAGDVLATWALASLDIPACTFLCGPSAAIPERAVVQIAQAAPSSVLVVDNERPALPGGAMAVVRALRAVGVLAGYARLPSSVAPAVMGPALLVDWLRLGGRAGNAAAVWRELAALVAERLR